MSDLDPVVVLKSLDLERLKFSNGYWRFRCPRCGDSAKHKSKTRGYLVNGGSILKSSVGCFNGCDTISFLKFIKDFGGKSILDSITFNSFRSKDTSAGILVNNTQTIENSGTGLLDYDPETIWRGLEPSKNHDEIEEYFESRLIVNRENRKYLYACLDQGALFKLDYCRDVKKYPALVYYDTNKRPVGLNVRLNTDRLKYRAVFDQGVNRGSVPFGIDKVKSDSFVIITEGEIDALSVINGVSCGSSAAWRRTVDVLASLNLIPILCFDTDFITNEGVLHSLKHAVEYKNINVFLPTKDWIYKDFNDALVKGGLTRNEITDYVHGHFYSGLKLKATLSKILRG